MKTVEQEIIKVIKEKLDSQGIMLRKIILFGSRARGYAKDDSDWDILIVVDKNLDFKEIKRIVAQIQWELAKLKIPNDIIIRSEEEFERYKNVVGYISYYANKEGVILK